VLVVVLLSVWIIAPAPEALASTGGLVSTKFRAAGAPK